MTTSFAPASLPLDQKEDLCRTLLDEFGVTISRATEGHELIHACRLPWHNEKTPSASLNYEKLAFKCLGCQSQGGLLWFISTMRGNASAREVTEWLETKTGLGGYEFDLEAVLNFINSVLSNRVRDKPIMPRFSSRVLEPWQLIHPYLTESPEDGGRGIPVENIEKMQVGYDPDQDKIIIPHFWRGELVGWQARRLSGTGAKYKSTMDMPRDRTIYNYDPSRSTALVVESPMSVLRHCHHQPMEATFGAAVTDAQIRLLASHDEVILWPDPDPAGWNALLGTEGQEGLISKLEPYLPVRVVDSPWFADPADLDDKEVDALVSGAIPSSLYERPTSTLRCWTCKKTHTGACA